MMILHGLKSLNMKSSMRVIVGNLNGKYEAIYKKELLLYKKNIMFGSGPSSGSKTNDVEVKIRYISI